jgi:hypothetical protein
MSRVSFFGLGEVNAEEILSTQWKDRKLKGERSRFKAEEDKNAEG